MVSFIEDEVVEFYVDDDNKTQSHILYQKTFGKAPVQNMPSKHLKEYLENQNIFIDNLFTKGDSMGDLEDKVDSLNNDTVVTNIDSNQIGTKPDINTITTDNSNSNNFVNNQAVVTPNVFTVKPNNTVSNFNNSNEEIV